MRTSTDRILTTHVGSLPRSKAVTEVVFGQERGEPQPGAESVIAAASTMWWRGRCKPEWIWSATAR